MDTCSSIEDVTTLIQAWQRAGQRVGFVPTMGKLHEGHLSLVRKAKQVCDRVVVSIFVNPLQFGEGEDFQTYPRALEADSKKLVKEKVDLLFCPDEKTMYPDGCDHVEMIEAPAELAGMLEGASRPGFFRGVATVVKRLFDIVEPDVAVFGEKDYQQLLVIRHMVDEFDLPIEIVGMPIMRERDGLAMSSRNGYLSVEERHKAPLLFQTLNQLREKVIAGDTDFSRLCKEARAQLETSGFQPDYIEIRRANDLQKPEGMGEKPLVILAAARLGSTRLIDNLIFEEPLINYD